MEVREVQADWNHHSTLLLFSFSPWQSLWAFGMFVCLCVCFLCTFVSCVEEQKVSAGLACVGGLWDSPWKQPKSQGHFLSWSSHLIFPVIFLFGAYLFILQAIVLIILHILSYFLDVSKNLNGFLFNPCLKDL